MKKWYDRWSDLKYPYPQGAHLMWTTGCGDWSSYYGLWRLWELTGDEEMKTLLAGLLEKLIDPSRFGVNDSRSMDFQSVWARIQLTGDMSVLETLRDPIGNFIKKGGHSMRRLHMLKLLDEVGWLEEAEAEGKKPQRARRARRNEHKGPESPCGGTAV